MWSIRRLKILTTIVLSLTLGLCAGAVNSWAQGNPSIFLTELESDLAIVTEMSLTNPVVGQQFSIVYRLRVRRSPAAVDINPQQFPGFWTEIVPLPGQTNPVRRRWKGSPATDFLLRQLVAYPLIEGELELPPLSLKIKRAGRRSARQAEWDVIGKSEPVAVPVRAIPSGGPLFAGTPFVGDLSGSMSAGEGVEKSMVMLDIEGTANLAFFRPKDWIRIPAGLTLAEDLLSSETLTQTRDIGGVRALSVLQRQRWALRVFPQTDEDIMVRDIALPTYDPIASEWRTVRIAGVSLAGSELPAGIFAASAPAGEASAEPFNWMRGLGLMAILAVIAGAVVWIRRRVQSKERDRITIPLLEKRMQTSPRSFLDGAHRLLAQYAQQHACGPEIGKGNDLADRCWRVIERHRFNVESPPVEVRDDIMNTLKVLLSRPVSGSTPGTPTNDP